MATACQTGLQVLQWQVEARRGGAFTGTRLSVRLTDVLLSASVLQQ